MDNNEIVKKLRLRANTFSTTPECDKSLMEEAADLIESLQAQLAEMDKICAVRFLETVRLSTQLSAYQQETKAAVDDMQANYKCSICKHKTQDIRDCVHHKTCGLSYQNFDWRGPQEAEKGESNA